ncbi:MAG TPA: GNAT family N-acetyltransferase [Solirubrobacteraceae bacterium]|nr:GNAT family N-acetyltransferase [Solirubrobacteraceae bacterium]
MRPAGPPAAGSAAVSCSVEALGGLEEAREDWAALAPATGNVFSTWEYADVWWRHAPAGQELWLHRVRAPDGRVAAVLPLCRHLVRGIAVVRLVGHGVADELGPVCAPQDRALAAAGLRAVLEERRRFWDILIAENVRSDAGWPALLGGRVVRREASPVRRIEGASWEELEQRFSRGLRRAMRYKERRLGREHGLRMRLCSDPARLDDDLDALFALHEARWAGGGSVAFGHGRRELHRDLARALLEHGVLRLWIAEADGRPAAAWYGFRYGAADSFYQSGRDPRFDALSLGSVLLWHTIREAARDGQAEYRLLRGDEVYKGRFADADEPVETVAVPAGRRSRAMLAAAGAMSSRPATRRFVPDALRR